MASDSEPHMSSTSDDTFNSLRNHFLIATPVIADGFFNRSLTYLCEHNASGAMGIVINHCLDTNLSEILKHLKIEALPSLEDRPVLAGGPVQMDHGFVLHHGPAHWDESTEVSQQVCLTTSRDILLAIASGEGPSEYLLALGYAGWGAGQLEAEMGLNSWLTVEADAEILFNAPASERLAAAGRRLGVNIDLLSAEAGHA